MSAPAGHPLEIEQSVLAEAGHASEAFTRPGPLQWQGSRRPLRFPLGEASCEAGGDEHGEFLELRFSLPPGCYATSVLREMLDAPLDDTDHVESGASSDDAPDES